MVGTRFYGAERSTPLCPAGFHLDRSPVWSKSIYSLIASPGESKTEQFRSYGFPEIANEIPV